MPGLRARLYGRYNVVESRHLNVSLKLVPNALRGYAVLDALRPNGRPTQSVEDGIPTGTVGTSLRTGG
jgi:hypothetical protein